MTLAVSWQNGAKAGLAPVLWVPCRPNGASAPQNNRRRQGADNRRMTSPIVIATRESRLALWQSHVRKRPAYRPGGACRPPAGAMTRRRATRSSISRCPRLAAKGLFVKAGGGAQRGAGPTWPCTRSKTMPWSCRGFVLAAVLVRGTRVTPSSPTTTPAWPGCLQGLRGQLSLPRDPTAGAAPWFARPSPCVATSTPGCASSMKAATTPSCWPPPASSSWVWAPASGPGSRVDR